MARIDARRLVWAVNRQFLLHGASLWIGTIGAVFLLGSGVTLLRSQLELRQVRASLSELSVSGEFPTNPPPAVPKPSSLPQTQERFDSTRRMLAVLQKGGLEPERIKFKYERSEDAGLYRQVAEFSVQASWKTLSQTLQSLQAGDRTVYISKLRVSRESMDQEMLEAEIQLSHVFLDRQGEPAR